MRKSRMSSFISGIVFAFLMIVVAVVYFINKDTIQEIYQNVTQSSSVASFVGEYQENILKTDLAELQRIAQDDQVLARNMQAAFENPDTYKEIAGERLDLYKNALSISSKALEKTDNLQTSDTEIDEIKNSFSAALQKRNEGYILYVSGLEKIVNGSKVRDEFVEGGKRFVEAKKLDLVAFKKVEEKCAECTIVIE